MIRAAILLCITSIAVAYVTARIEPICGEAVIRDAEQGETIEPPAQLPIATQ